MSVGNVNVLFHFVNPCDGYVYALGRLKASHREGSVVMHDVFLPVSTASSALLANMSNYRFIPFQSENMFNLSFADIGVQMAFTVEGSPNLQVTNGFTPYDVFSVRGYLRSSAPGFGFAKINGVFILPATGSMIFPDNGSYCMPEEVINRITFIQFDRPIRFGIAVLIDGNIESTFRSISRSFAICNDCDNDPIPEPFSPEKTKSASSLTSLAMAIIAFIVIVAVVTYVFRVEED